jgi:hypothetical protein
VSEAPGNQTPNTPDVSETELRETKVDDLRRIARDEGVPGASDLRKEELVQAVAKERQQGRGGSSEGTPDEERPGNQTPDTPDVSETELRDMKVDDLREVAQREGVSGTSGMRKEQLVQAIAEVRQGRAGASEDVGAGPDGGRLRTGPETSKSLHYSQEVTSPDDDPERPGRSLATTHHQVIKEWAQARGGTPATVEKTEHGDHLGVLRFDFGGSNQTLRHVSWDEWFATFDARELNFIYQEERSDGRPSTFFRLESPNREDA